MSTPQGFARRGTAELVPVASAPAPDPGPGDPMIGTVIGSRYLIQRKLGRGATGSVYWASHVKFGRAFAIKVLHGERTGETKLLRRFDREAELSGMVHHPNLTSVIDVGETPEGIRYMVMELAIGIDLGTVIEDEAPLSASRVIHLLRGLCEGLYHAHERGVVHRDLKPENVIIERDDHFMEVPRIVDFGIAIARDEAEDPESPDRLTTNGLVLGTPQYMAPEQATGFAMDHRIDLFALGVFTYEMLTARLPFDGTGAEVARANILVPTPRMAERAPGVVVDPLLEAFTRALMEKDPNKRPATALAARELLDLIAHDRPAAAARLGVVIEAPKPPPPLPRAVTAPVVVVPVTEEVEPVASPASRRRRIAIAALVGGVVLAAGLWIARHPSPPAPVAPAPPPVVAAIEPTADASIVMDPTPAPPPAAPTPAPAVPAPPPVHPVAHPRPPVPAPPPPAAPAPPTAQQVADLYATTGRELHRAAALHAPEDIEAMSIRFRRLRLADALATDDSRRAAIEALGAIRRDIAALDKPR